MLARDLLLADPLTDSILRFDGTSGAPLGAFVSSGSGGLVAPLDPTFGPDGNLYVISNDPGAAKILRFDGTSGAFLEAFVDTGDGGFAGASAIEFGPNGDLYVATNTSAGVLRYDGGTGALVSAIGSGDVVRAAGLGFGFDQNLYVMDSDGLLNRFADRIVRYDPDNGLLIDEFVKPGNMDDVAFFSFGPDGHLYVPEVATGDVLRFHGTTGEVQTVFIPGDSREAKFDIVFGPDGNAYTSNGGIQRFDGERGTVVDSWIEGVSGTLTFFPKPGPPTDLEVVDIQLPIVIEQNVELSIMYTVTNNSLAATSVNDWEDVIYLSTDDVFDPSDRELGRIERTSGLAAGSSYTETLTTSSASVSLGEYYVFVFTDRRGLVSDPLRLNNLRKTTDKLEVFPPLASSHDPDHSIAVGRTLSAYTTADVTNNELTITYTVYNLTDGYAQGTQLTTTLGPDVTFVGGSQLPNLNGQELTWTLGTIEPLHAASVEMTVSLGASNPLQLDIDPRADATVDATPVHDLLPSAILRTDVIDSALLASTSDANTADPFVLAKAAELDQDPAKIFSYLTQKVDYESYPGSLRGARGTLWSGAGNSLDEASLAVGAASIIRHTGTICRGSVVGWARRPATHVNVS